MKRCPHHALITNHWYKHFFEICKREDTCSTSKDVRFFGGDKKVTFWESISQGGYYWPLALVSRNAISDHPGIARILDPDWAGLDVVNDWKGSCLSSHGATCNNPLKVWYARPAWLIDVDRKCLVPGNVDGGYVALSSAYGGGHIGCPIDADLFEKLQVFNALEDMDLLDYMPAVIRTAGVFDFRSWGAVSWADTICITHENQRSEAGFPTSDLERRVRSSRPYGEQLSPCGLPSWSWIRWKVTMDMGYKGEAIHITGRYMIEETTPITEWYTSHSPDSSPSQWRRIRSTWYESRNSYKDFTKPLPPGWTRHDVPQRSTSDGGPDLYPDGCGDCIFKYDSLPEDQGGNKSAGHSWYYPFPIPEVDASTLPEMPEQTEYLFCKTSKGQLAGCQKGEGNVAVLYNDRGKAIGLIDLMNEEFLTRFPKSLAEDEARLLVDLVAVRKVRTYSKTYYEAEESWGEPVVKRDTYLVRWVEWKDGIAYRLASGHVQVEEWGKLSLVTIDLTLG
ncbi:hypothetical protein F53441_12199 [Fusarium austroafricanum]|uniref:Heterokaryon incompatibility domain-containing protein n=1 Tax=Fusarium austroafricanum TaxID=2364996 RepID=A0A8H4NQS2_9HYPO|nr:hypothetical protein F53441_12199 [Fusarium austroafricanum]